MLNLQFNPFPEIKTERLFLREQKVSDKHEVFRLRSTPRVNQHLDRPKARTVEDAVAHIEKISNLFQDNQLISWAITEKGKANLIGTVGFMNFDSDKSEGEVGYEL